jgi:RNA-directed DNA polymerase
MVALYRKAVERRSQPREKRGEGKATTASEQTSQSSLLPETADSPRGAVPGPGMGQPKHPARYAVPKSGSASCEDSPVMTMEEVASSENLMRAFEQVERNDGAPGPDRQVVREMREHVEDVLPELSRSLLDGSYCPGMIRRVWIPKAGGGQRGLGIPNVIDRIVQQAVHQVLGPRYEPTFHESSHGFRPAGAVTRRSPRRKSTWRKGMTGAWIWIWTSSSTESITTG